MIKHELKCWPEYFEEVWLKNKTFEIRKDDRNIQKDDILILREWNKDTKKYTGRSIECKVSYVLRDEKFCKKGLCTIGLRYMTNKDRSKFGWWL